MSCGGTFLRSLLKALLTAVQVWSTSTCEFVRTLNGHKRGIACLQYRDRLVVSGSSDNTIRWVALGARRAGPSALGACCGAAVETRALVLLLCLALHAKVDELCMPWVLLQDSPGAQGLTASPHPESLTAQMPQKKDAPV